MSGTLWILLPRASISSCRDNWDSIREGGGVASGENTSDTFSAADVEALESEEVDQPNGIHVMDDQAEIFLKFVKK